MLQRSNSDLQNLINICMLQISSDEKKNSSSKQTWQTKVGKSLNCFFSENLVYSSET